MSRLLGRLTGALLAMGFFTGMPPGQSVPTWALDQNSPKVQQLIQETQATLLQMCQSGAPGPRAVGCYALLKSDLPKDNPVFASMVADIRTSPPTSHTSYQATAYLLFLVTLDHEMYRGDIDKVHTFLLGLQKPHGGWGYEDEKEGDTSMTQYALLALWELENHNIPTPDDNWLRATNWLLRTQDPSGSFCYKPHDPGHYDLVAQNPKEIRVSIFCGGAGSLYIVLDHYQRKGARLKKLKKRKDTVPSVLREVENEREKERKRQLANMPDMKLLEAAIKRADGWFQTNYTKRSPYYQFYYLYVMERYFSFRELTLGEKRDKSADHPWYDNGIEIIEADRRNGRWEHAVGIVTSGSVCDTAFVLLFMGRAAKKTLESAPTSLGTGTLIGGHGLPANEAELAKASKKAAGKALRGPAEEMIKKLDNPNNAEREAAFEGIDSYMEQADDATIGKLAARMRKLLTDPDPEARVAALKTLARTRNLDDVPLMIAALDDPMEMVAQQAHIGLRYLSRRISVDPELPEAGIQRRVAVQKWKEWFLTVRPDTEFLDEK